MRLTVFIFIVVTLVACDTDRVYEDNKDFVSRSWLVNDTVSFEFHIDDAAMLYNLKCNIRSSVDYPYSRIFVNYVLEDSTHRVLASKLVSSYLFDGKTGEPQGNSSIGDIYDHSFSLLDNRQLNEGKYFLKLQQYMRTDTLHGILAAGVRVEKSHQ